MGVSEGLAWEWSNRRSETLEPLERLGETWWLGLRLARGVDPVSALLTAGLEPDRVDDPARSRALELVEQGLLDRAPNPGPAGSPGAPAGERFRLTPRGLPLADAVAREFLGSERTDPEQPGEARAAGDLG